MALPRLINVGGPRQKSEFLIPGTIATSSFRLLHENDLLHELGDNRSEDKHSKDISENREDLANVYFLKVEWQPPHICRKAVFLNITDTWRFRRDADHACSVTFP